MKKQGFWIKLNLKSSRILLAGLLFAVNSVFATSTQGGALPFESGLKSIADAISGPVAGSIATILIVATGLMNAFGEFGDGMKKLVNIGFWISLIFGVASLISTLNVSGATF